MATDIDVQAASAHGSDLSPVVAITQVTSQSKLNKNTRARMQYSIQFICSGIRYLLKPCRALHDYLEKNTGRTAQWYFLTHVC